MSKSVLSEFELFNYKIKYNQKELEKILSRLEFPIMIWDSECYRLSIPNLSIKDKPFLFGSIIVNSVSELMENPIPNFYDRYELIIDWTKHNSDLEVMKKFANFLTTNITAYQVKTIVVAGQHMEKTLLNFLKDKSLISNSLYPKSLFDLYDLIINSNPKSTPKLAIYDKDGNLVKKHITYQIANLLKMELNDAVPFILEYDHEYWHDKWKLLDKLYQNKLLNSNLELINFQNEISSEVIKKNRQDLILTLYSLRFLFKILFNIKNLGN